MLLILRTLSAPWHITLMLLFMLARGIMSGLATATSYDTTDLNATFYYLTLNPNAVITKFEGVQVVPASSNALIVPGNVQAVWPALQNTKSIIQTAVANQGSIGEWYYIGLEYCCTPDDWQADKAQKVYPGDRITTKYELTNEILGIYTVTWNVERSQNGIQAGVMGFSSASVFNPEEHQIASDQGPFTKALFAIETQRGAKWDFGPVQWDRITIQAKTTISDWCHSPRNNTELEYYLDTAAVTITGSQVICSFSCLIIGDSRQPTAVSTFTATSHVEPGVIPQAQGLAVANEPTAMESQYGTAPIASSSSADQPTPSGWWTASRHTPAMVTSTNVGENDGTGGPGEASTVWICAWISVATLTVLTSVGTFWYLLRHKRRHILLGAGAQ